MKNAYGQHVFVTGASSGIGQACALMFAKNGCKVTGISRNIKEGFKSFSGGGSLTLRRLDVTDEAATREFVEALPGVDIAVLCAGMGVAGPAETTPAEMTRRQMEVNYFGTLNAARPCLTRMRGQHKGLLLVIGSIAGRVSIPMQSQYSASKYALEAFTDAVRMEMQTYGVKACIAGVAIRLLIRENPPARVPVGVEYKALMVLLRFLPDRLKESILSKMYLPKSV